MVHALDLVGPPPSSTQHAFHMHTTHMILQKITRKTNIAPNICETNLLNLLCYPLPFKNRFAQQIMFIILIKFNILLTFLNIMNSL